eukprot:CAMPEP_0201552286 /NCGR_PEP_ID=MMETSP0173_2-20130828/14602_1 /ASSEMBLY_ACC=CAM_ASM_000268 /TAXON_ID=218659 /ORGANISM="Vexillifera sp., Strain DIVA3 564/2" /LENGTH=411 /DNA_ID=CAMNT_0047962739 /DNA_START=9 /DNA_END=1244 /DNA_ORIENTATION=-
MLFNHLTRSLSTIVSKKAYRNFATASSWSNQDIFHPTEEHRQLREMIANFSKDQIDPQASEQDRLGVLNQSLFKQVGDLGLLGITIPEKDGGAGMDAIAACIVHEEMSKYDPGFTLAYLAHSMLFVNNFYYAGNDAQRAKYLPGVLSGEKVGGMGMTEPGAGTDVLGMKTTAKREGDVYVLNGSKTYITNTVEGEVFLVYAKIEGKITAFLVDRSMEGFSTSNKIDKIGMRGSTMGELIFDNCIVPVENRLGEEGSGVTHMMRNLEIERLTLAAMSVGIAERCVDIMVDFGKERQAFGSSINKFGQIQRYIGDSFAETLAAKCLTYNEARQVAPNVENRVGSDAAKLFAAPVGKRVADAAMQVMGGAGYCREYPVERLWRDAKLIEIGGGTLEAHQKNLVKDLAKSGTPWN